MMKKKAYSKPMVSIVLLQQEQALLTASYEGPANAPESEYDPVFLDEL